MCLSSTDINGTLAHASVLACALVNQAQWARARILNWAPLQSSDSEQNLGVSSVFQAQIDR